MEITINLPETTLKKVRAFGILCKGQTADLETVLIDLVDEAVSNAIIDSVYRPKKSEIFEEPRRGKTLNMLSGAMSPSAAEPVGRSYEEEPMGISAELGDDEEDTEDPELDEAAFVPAQGGLTEDDLLHEMEVDDPEHEVKVSAPPPRSVKKTVAEEVFAEVAGMPYASEDRIQKRKKKVNSKGRVIAFTGSEESSFS